MARYDIGDTVRVTGTFKDVNDTVQDPTAVSLTVRQPSGRLTTYTYAAGQLTKASTGVYTYDIDVTESGRWIYRFYSTGSYKAAGEESFLVNKAEAR